MLKLYVGNLRIQILEIQFTNIIYHIYPGDFGQENGFFFPVDESQNNSFFKGALRLRFTKLFIFGIFL